MGRTVDDVAALLDVMAGADGSAPLSSAGAAPPSPLPPHEGTWRGNRIAWVGDFGGHLATEAGLLDVCRQALTVFEDLGCEVADALPDYPPELIWSTVLTWRWWSVLKRHDLYADPVTRAELKPEVIWEVEHGLRLRALDVAQVEMARIEWYDAALRFLDTYDFVVAPSTQVFPFPLTTHWPSEIDGRPMDSYHRWMETVAPWSMTGLPVLGMPAGFDGRGLPAGIQLVGRPGADARVLQLAKAYEERTNWVRDHPPPDA
jgi:amidase